MFATPDLKDRPARARILLTAHRLFYADGVRATGIDRVIAESGVTKVTFYRHFPSKNDLIHAFLHYRHETWMNWFTDALRRHGAKRRGIKALLPTLREWFEDEGFRGCAFINSIGELGASLPDVVAITRMHKQHMTAVIAGQLLSGKQAHLLAQAIALAIDGAIVHAQWADGPEAALSDLARLLNALQASMNATA